MGKSLQEQSDIRWAQTFDTLFLVLRQSMASVAQVFVHRRMGSQYLNGTRWFVAMCVLAMLTQGCQSYRDFAAMFYLGYVVTAAWIIQHIDIARRRRRFDLEHSNYNGFPVLCDITGLPEELVKLWLEPITVCAFGILLGKFGGVPMFGITFALAGLSMWMNRIDQIRHERVVVEEMYDAELYGSSIAQRFRQLKGMR